MVLTELLQNAVEHGYPVADGAEGTIVVTAVRTDGRAARSPSTTTGRGCRRASTWTGRRTLGLSIVRHAGRVRARRSARRSGRRRRAAAPGPRSTYRSSCASGVQAAQAVRTRARALRRFSARRSSSLRPPQTPWSCPASRAHCEALFAHLAASAHLLGLLDLEDGRTGVADREEQLRVLVEARGAVAPIHGWGFLLSGHIRAARVVVSLGWGCRWRAHSGHDRTSAPPCPSSVPRIGPLHKGHLGSRGSQGLRPTESVAIRRRAALGSRVTEDARPAPPAVSWEQRCWWGWRGCSCASSPCSRSSRWTPGGSTLGITTALFFLVLGAGLLFCAWGLFRVGSWARGPVRGRRADRRAALVQLLGR